MEINKVAVVGAGLMGSGITQNIAQAGLETINIDVSTEQLDKANKRVVSSLERLVQKEKISEEDATKIKSLISYSNNLEDVKGVDLIIEAVPENMELKKKIFAELDSLADQETLLVSNTSGLSVSEIASVTNRPDKVMGIHFFYPAPVMKLVELIRGISTSDHTYQAIRKFAQSINKESVDAPELPGFLVNRILVPLMNEGAFCVMEGSTPEDVDNSMKLGANHPMGPLELADFVGLDVMLATMEGLYEGFKDSKYRPCPLIRTLVKAGHLGRKSGKGFYDYSQG